MYYLYEVCDNYELLFETSGKLTKEEKMDFPATQAMDDEDFVPTQQFATDDRAHEHSLVGMLLISNSNEQRSIFSGITLIGRLPTSTIMLNDETVSKRHAEIEAESTDKAVFIKDLGSSNKTKINDTKLRPNSSYQIKDNDKLTFGKITATFKMHRTVDDSLISCTPQVNRRANAVIPDTPDSSMNNSSALEGEVSTIPGTQEDENDSCFRRPQIPVRTSISNEQESPKYVPFVLDDVPSPLSNSKDKDIDISEVDTQRYTVNNTKEMTDNSIYTVETQKVMIPRKSSINSNDNEDRRTLNSSSVKKILSNEFENQPLEDVETQAFACAKADLSSSRSKNTSIYSAETQKVLPDELENQSMENIETQPFVPVNSGVDKSNLADVSIHSAPTQKMGSTSTVSENELIENLDTQHFTLNRLSLSSAKRKSANLSIHSAETQKVVADHSLDNTETTSDCSKVKSADVSIYSAATQKIESTSEKGAIENLETQTFDITRVSLNGGSHQLVNQEKMVDSLSFSIQDIDTMPFTKCELPSGEKSSNIEVQNADDILFDSAANATKLDSDDKVHDSENEKDDNKSNTKTEESVPTSSKKSNISQMGDKIDEKLAQNQEQNNETLSKSMSKNLLQISSKFDKSKSLVESDDEEEIFSQNLIENSPFCLLLDDSKNDSKEQSNVDLHKYMEHDNEKIVDSECNMSSNKADGSTEIKNSTKNKSTIEENDDSETDEEGVFSNHLSEENENQKSHKETGNDSGTDEEGAFSNHLSEEKVEKSKSKPEGDAETDEEGVFSGKKSEDSKKMKNTNSSKIIDESESEDEGISSNNLSKNKASKDFIDTEEKVVKTAEDISSVSQSAKQIIPRSPKIDLSLNNLVEVDQRESPISESDDDIFNENYEGKRTSSSNLDKKKSPIVDKKSLDSTPNSLLTYIVSSGLSKNVDDNNEVDEMAPTQILETDDLSLAPTQIANTRRMSNAEEERSKEIDELAPTQLIETQNVPVSTEDTCSTPARKVSRVTDLQKEVAKEYDDMDLAPTQKIVETQKCPESLAPTQKVVDTQLCSEEMGALQFSESLAPTQVIETETNDVENEIATSAKISPNTSKRQLKVEITNKKKLKTADVSEEMEVDVTSTVEHNLNEMFEGSEEKIVDNEPPIETQKLENILESSQIEENSAIALNESIDKPSPTLSKKRSSIKNRRRPLMLNKSGSLNSSNKSVVNLNYTIEKNLNDLFDTNVDNVETPEPEPMLTQQLENVLNSSQDSSHVDSNEEEGRTIVKRKSRLSLSMNLNSSMLQIQKEKEKFSSNASTKVIETTSQSSLNEKSPQKEDYSTNLEDQKDNATSEEISSKNDKDIVYRRGTIGFTDDLKPVSTFDRVAFFDRYSSTDSQSDDDNIFKLRSLRTSSSEKRVCLHLESVDLNSSLSSLMSDQDVEKKKLKSPVLSSKKTTTVHYRFARKRDPVVRLSKSWLPLYHKHVKPIKPVESRVMKYGTIGFTDDLQPVESEELVSAASTESEDDLRAQVGEISPKIDTVSDDSSEQLFADSMEKEKSDSEDDLFKGLPDIKIAGTSEYPTTASQLAVLNDRETDSESIKSFNLEIPDRWKWYAEKRYDSIYEKFTASKKKEDESESENDEGKEIQTNNVSASSVTDDREERSAAINKILAQIGADKPVNKRNSNRGAEKDSGKENADKNVVTTRSRTLKKDSPPPSPKLTEDDDADSDKTNSVVSSSSDDENSQELSIIPKYRPVSPLRINVDMLSMDRDGVDDSKLEFKAPGTKRKRIVRRAKVKTSPLNARRRRKSACINDIDDVTQYENNADNKNTGNSNVGTVDKDGLVFQVSRNSKKTATTATSRMLGSTTNRTKRIIDSDDDNESTCEPSPKRTKTLANRQKLQQVTVVISPLKDRLAKLREANRLNVANLSSNFKQTDSIEEKKRVTSTPKTLDGYVTLTKTARTDSSDLSAMECSIVEDKNENKNKPKTRGKPAARNQKAKVDTSSERNANSSKENYEEYDVQKPKTRGRERRNQTTYSSASEKASSQDEIPASDVENKSARSTRGRLVRQNQTKKKDEAKVTKQKSKVIQDSDSEVLEEPKTAARKNTRSRLATTVEKSGSGKNDVADHKNDKVQDKDAESQSSSQSESVSVRSTRTRRNKVNQESDSGGSEALEAVATRGGKKRPANNKSDLVIKVTDVDSNKETMAKSDETKEQSKDEINVFKLMKKKINPKTEEPTKVLARKTRSRATKNKTVIGSSSEESQEVSEIMKNSILQDSKTTTRRRGRAINSSTSYVENDESSDDVFEKPISRPKRARLAKADQNQSSQPSDANEDSKSIQSSQKSTRSKRSPSPSPTPRSDAALTPSRISRLSLSPTKRPKVLFTGEKSEAHRNILTKLGGVETEEFNSCSVLITDKVRRTFKFLCSLARGIPIASVKWLDESKKANRFLDLEEYILKDPEAEAKFQFNLKDSLDKARKHKLLEGYTVLLAPKIKQPPIAELKEMVISSGGKPLVRAPAKWPAKCVVVTTVEELDSAKKLITKAPKSVTVQSIEFILTGILRQNSNLNEFQLLD